MVELDNKEIREDLNYDECSVKNQRRGKRLEKVARKTLGTVPGFEIIGIGQHDRHHSQEMDLVLWNDQARSGLYFIPTVFAVECKNLADPVDSKDLRLFSTKMKDRGIEFGIVFAKGGITGKELRGTSGYHVLENALRDGLKIIVITTNELEEISDTDQIVELIRKKVRSIWIPVKLKVN